MPLVYIYSHPILNSVIDNIASLQQPVNNVTFDAKKNFKYCTALQIYTERYKDERYRSNILV